jgi:hypothetical protein
MPSPASSCSSTKTRPTTLDWKLRCTSRPPVVYCSEKGVRLAQKIQVGPCVAVGIQLQRAEVGPTSGPTWRLSHLLRPSRRPVRDLDADCAVNGRLVLRINTRRADSRGVALDLAAASAVRTRVRRVAAEQLPRRCADAAGIERTPGHARMVRNAPVVDDRRGAACAWQRE